MDKMYEWYIENFDYVFPALVTLAGVLGGYIIKQVRKIFRGVKWIAINQSAIDYGIEKTFNKLHEKDDNGNGGIYAKYRRERLNEECKKDSFINQKLK